MKEKITAAPKELVRRGLDDGTERLRGQLRDAAQEGRSGDDYGGDRIEDTAVAVPRQAAREIVQIVRHQIQHNREKNQIESAADPLPQPEPVTEPASPPAPPDIPSEADTFVADTTVRDAFPMGDQPRSNSEPPAVRAREPARPQITAEHPPIKEKADQVISEKPAVTFRISVDGPAVKAKERPTASAVRDAHPPQGTQAQMPSAIRSHQSAENLRTADVPRPQVVPELSPDIHPDVGDSGAVVREVPQVGLLPRDSGQTPPVRAREPAAHQTAVEPPPIKEKADQVAVSEKPAATPWISTEGPAVRTKEEITPTVRRDVQPQAQDRHQSPTFTDGRPGYHEGTPSIRTGESTEPQVVAEHPVIREKATLPTISEKPTASARVRMDGPSIKIKQELVADLVPDVRPALKRERKPSPGEPDSVVETRIRTETPTSAAPADTTHTGKPVVSQRVRAQTPDIKTHEQVTDIKVRPCTSQFPIRTRESAETVEAQVQLPGDYPPLPSDQRGIPPGHRDTTLSAPKDTMPRSHRAVRETALYPAEVDTPAVRQSDAKRVFSGSNRTAPTPAKVKERRTASGIQPKLKGKRSPAQAVGRPGRRKIKTAERSGRPAAKAVGRTVRMRRQIERTRQAARSVETAVKRTAEAIGKALKAARAALQELMAAAVAGGGITVVIVLIICLVGFLLASPLGMFFSDEVSSGPAIPDTIVQINDDFTNRIEQIKEENTYDSLDLDNAGVSAALANWRDVLAVYAVRITTDSTSPGDVLTLTPEKQTILRETFWDMNVIQAETQTHSGTTTLKIIVTAKDASQTADEYGFNADQRKLLEEMLSPAYQEMFQNLTGNYRNISLTAEQIQQMVDNLPAGLSTERKQVILTAYQLLGKVNYFWGGKSLVLGWDSRWGTPREVTAAGSPSSGTVRPYGLDCSGFVDWVFYNVSNGSYVIGHGGGARMQHSYCRNISWSQAIPGDLAFYPEDTHVGIVCGFDERGNVLIIHCASGANNVMVTGKGGFTSIARPNYYTE